MDSILNKEFPGKIILGFDEDGKRGRYKVYVPELMYGIYDEEDQNGIFCVNHTNKTRDTYIEQDDGTKLAAGGTYFPLQIGTRVIVKFFSEDFESGYIDRIVSDYYTKSQPSPDFGDTRLTPEQRDDYYQVVKSKAKDMIAISTSDHGLTHQIYIYYDDKKVTLVLDDAGLHEFVKTGSITETVEVGSISMTVNKGSISGIAGFNISFAAGIAITLAAPTISLGSTIIISGGNVTCPGHYENCPQYGCGCFCDGSSGDGAGGDGGGAGE